MFVLQMLTVLSLTVIFLASVEGNGVQMQRDVQCCMLYSQGKVRAKDVLRFEVQTKGPDCSIRAIMQVFQLSIPGAQEHRVIWRHVKRKKKKKKESLSLAQVRAARAERHCHVSRSNCYGRAPWCNCQGGKRGNMWEQQAG
uniref:C-C motif chemokine 21-like n=1 Tax=Fundulus heteroclitus TaxID=8078 RepID=A0A3Q2Q913_FUNHE